MLDYCFFGLVYRLENKDQITDVCYGKSYAYVAISHTMLSKA